MEWALRVNLIKGLMFGMEYVEDDDLFWVVLDIGFIRFLYIRANAPLDEH